jgi:transcriptional regulator with PAS, ATPase and Fis domain
VLQEEEFYKLGSIKNIKVNVRIIAATNKNLYEEIQKGTFRKDLFFRLNINSIYLPPLREKKGDITLLANHFLKIYNKKYKKNIKRISTNLLNIFNSYNFPGNVRELMKENSYISKNFPDDLTLKSLQEVEKDHIKKILTKTNMNRTAAAKILGISRVNLIAKIKKYELE